MRIISANRAFKIKLLLYPVLKYNLRYQFKDLRSSGAISGTQGFERYQAAQDEDRQRYTKLMRWADKQSRLGIPRKVSHFLPANARNLARRLKPRMRAAYPDQTFASAAFMRRFRLYFVGAVLKLVHDDPTADFGLATVIPPSWRIPGHALLAVKPRQYLERFRQQLVRAGLKETSGWFIAFLHGDYDPTHDTYQLHLHIVATDGMISLIKRLAALPSYRRGDPTQPGFVRQPIRIRRLTDPERRVPYYVAQAFWPSKASFKKGGVWRRHSRRQRIPDSRLVEWLIWIDQQSFSDLLMLRGCRISGQALVPQNDTRQNA